jgi:hypothetical protein
MTNVRETKRADELKPGDWTIYLGHQRDFDGLGRAEILSVHPYTDDAGIAKVLVVASEVGYNDPQFARVNADEKVQILGEDELRAGREEAERAKFIAGLHAFADWLSANPWAPVKRPSGYGQPARLQIDLHGVDMDAKADAVAKVREIADRFGVKVDESLDDRTDASVEIGAVAYSVIAWHREGRPAEAEADR